MTTVNISPGIMDHSTERNPYGRILVDIEPENRLSAAAMMRQADLDYTVIKELPVTVGDMTYPKRAGTIALHHGQRFPIDIVGKDYETIQPVDALAPFDWLISEGFAKGWEQAGRFDYHRTFALMELESESRLDRDPHMRKAMVSLANDGSGSLRIRPWAQRIRCTNQEPMIFARRGGVVSIRHTRSARTLVPQLRGTIEQVLLTMDQHERLVAQLEESPASSHDIDEFVARMFPDRKSLLDKSEALFQRGERRAVTLLSEKRATLKNLIMFSPTTEELRSRRMSKAVLLHSAIEYSDYFSTVRGGVQQDARARKMLLGTDVPFKRRAASIVMSL